MAGLLSAPPSSHPPNPRKEFPSENIIPKPMIQYAMAENANTTKFFARMFVAFLARQSPDSTHPKPAFIQKTRNAVIITQRVSSITFKSAGEGPSLGACANAVPLNISVNRMASGNHLRAPLFFVVIVILLLRFAGDLRS